jgi:ribose-phosphate pyrophosphokinase
MPYSRQDRRTNIGDSFGLKIFADMLNRFDIDKIITFDIHSKESLEFFKSEIINLTPDILFAEPLKQHDLEDVIVLATDLGGEDRAKLVSDLIGCPYFVPMKKRDGNMVEHSLDEAKSLKGKNIIIVDDIIDSGKTILSLLDILQANSIFIYATHIISETGIKLIEQNKSVKKIYISTELDRPSSDKVEWVDCSKIISVQYL